jgi:hypothetical protein
VYRALAGEAGCNAHCSFSESQLFEEGIALVVRPPGSRWRSFSALSGGQQALAALALSFALQDVMPSPFTFFDEIDACELRERDMQDACALWQETSKPHFRERDAYPLLATQHAGQLIGAVLGAC